MDMFVIRGGRPLTGRVAVSGAKNAALPILAASLMADGPVTLSNVPDLVDVRSLTNLLSRLGVLVERFAEGTVRTQVIDDANCVAEYDLVRRMRASVCVLGPLLARRKRACVSLPGGCNIGHRPIDLHLKGLAALGAEIRIERGYVIAEAERLKGTVIPLGGPFGSTVTGTCNVLCAAVLAEGRTVIEAAACEPEVVDLAKFLTGLGANIEGAGTPNMIVEGVPQLRGSDQEHRVIPDRIEAATLLCAGAITRGEVTVDRLDASHLTAVTEALRQMGVEITGDRTRLTVSTPGDLRPVDCMALPYPAIPTDVQAQLTSLLTQAAGTSVVTDRVFPDRFLHVPELARLGASLRKIDGSAVIQGRSRLTGAQVMASDLRASAALVLAGLAAEGETVVRRIYHLDRGYERLEEKLALLGADVQRVEDRGPEQFEWPEPAVGQEIPGPSVPWPKRPWFLKEIGQPSEGWKAAG